MNPSTDIVFIIESPGKIQAFKEVFSFAKHILATGGHFFRNPNSLTPLGIDEDLKETSRLPDPEIAALLKTCCANMTVVLATDNDDEGHVIASDVYKIVQPVAKKIVRMTSPGLDPETLWRAFEYLHEYDPLLARPGTARRILDRLIGATFSGDGVAVGRVSSALLGHLADADPVIGVLTLEMPSADGLPWQAQVEVTQKTLALWRERMEWLKQLPPVDFKVLPEELEIIDPWNFDDAVIALSSARY